MLLNIRMGRQTGKWPVVYGLSTQSKIVVSPSDEVAVMDCIHFSAVTKTHTNGQWGRIGHRFYEDK